MPPDRGVNKSSQSPDTQQRPRVTVEMVWPFRSTASGDGKDDKHSRHDTSWRENNGSVLQTVKEWGYVASAGVVGLGALHIYVNYFRRIPSASYIRPSFFRKRSLFGRVTRVGDGDNFHLFHTPGGRFVGWGWLRKVPENRKQLKERTVRVHQTDSHRAIADVYGCRC